VGVEEFGLEILQGRLVQLELPLERPIGDPSALAKQRHHLIEYGIKIHHRPSTFAVPGAVASGNVLATVVAEMEGKRKLSFSACGCMRVHAPPF
jgi:hypothetical protein